MSDTPPIDRPKKTPGPAKDPRREHPAKSDHPQPQPATPNDPQGPPEGYAEEEPGKSAHEQPNTKPLPQPKGVEPKVAPEGENKDDRAQRKAAGGGKIRETRGGGSPGV